jgi:hypothetical protein
MQGGLGPVVCDIEFTGLGRLLRVRGDSMAGTTYANILKCKVSLFFTTGE